MQFGETLIDFSATLILVFKTIFCLTLTMAFFQLQHGCIYNIENTDQEVGVRALRIATLFLAHTDVPARLAYFARYASTFEIE